LSSIIWKVLKTNPSFLIIDEPEKGIDEETMIKIMNWIFDTYKGVIFLITHNESIKKIYNFKIQSIVKYKFMDTEEIDTQLYQEFL
jgi:ABC-type multidrug transport system ATPase subunit